MLDAERTLLTAQDQVVQSKSQLGSNLISLYKALGEGWMPVAGMPPERPSIHGSGEHVGCPYLERLGSIRKSLITACVLKLTEPRAVSILTGHKTAERMYNLAGALIRIVVGIYNHPVRLRDFAQRREFLALP